MCAIDVFFFPSFLNQIKIDVYLISNTWILVFDVFCVRIQLFALADKCINVIASSETFYKIHTEWKIKWTWRQIPFKGNSMIKSHRFLYLKMYLLRMECNGILVLFDAPSTQNEEFSFVNVVGVIIKFIFILFAPIKVTITLDIAIRIMRICVCLCMPISIDDKDEARPIWYYQNSHNT